MSHVRVCLPRPRRIFSVSALSRSLSFHFFPRRRVSGRVQKCPSRHAPRCRLLASAVFIVCVRRAARRGSRPKRPSPAPRVLSAPRPPPPSHSATRNRLACRSASVSRENQQQIIFSVLNKLLYFDTRQRGAVVFSGSHSGTWGAHARERRRTAASWGTGPNAVLRGTSHPQL